MGKKDIVEDELRSLSFPEGSIEIKDAPDVIETAEAPVLAIRKKKESSMVVALNMVKHGEADAFVSAGSSGAILVGGQVIIGKARGVKRAPLAPLIPTAKGACLLIDCGANVDARAEHLAQFARMGSIYMENAVGVRNPKVAIVNIGAEKEKGNALVKEAYPLLETLAGINFIGNIEARDIPSGLADVVVCEAFVGNVILKLYEGVGATLLGELKNAFMSGARSKIGAMLAKPALKDTLKKFDASSYGGAPLLGLKSLVVKAHGSSTAKEIKNSILQCETFARQDINSKILEAFSEEDMVSMDKVSSDNVLSENEG